MIYADVDQMAQLLTKKILDLISSLQLGFEVFNCIFKRTLKDKDVEQKMYF